MDFWVYAAGPVIGKTYNESEDWRNKLKKELGCFSHGFRSEIFKINVLSPLRGKKELTKRDEVYDSQPEKLKSPLTKNRGITCRDKFDVRRSHLVVANFLDTTEYSVGTIIEVTVAKENKKPVIAIIKQDNIHFKHPMLSEDFDFIVESVEEAARLVKDILLP